MGKDGLLIKAAVPLQAADLLAYELFDPCRKIEKDGRLRKIKTTLTELDKRVAGEFKVVEPKNIEDLFALLNDLENLPDFRNLRP